MRNIIKINVIFLLISIIFSSQSIASENILPLPKPTIGKEVKEMPASLTKYRQATPIYKSLPGWEAIPENIWDKGYEFFPKTLKEYILFIEKEVKCPVKIVSVGPQRHETIIR